MSSDSTGGDWKTFPSNRDQARGVLLGLACGDALGCPVEFRSPTAIKAEFGTLDEMIGHGTHNQPPGTITDDSEMMLCIARSLVEIGRFDPEDIASRFEEWLASEPFDVGLMTRDAIDELRRGSSPGKSGKYVWSRRQEGSNAGNGSLMRCAPYALAYSQNPTALVAVSQASSRITHYDPRCRDACAVLNSIIAAQFNGVGDVFANALSLDLTDEVRSVVEGVVLGTVEESDLQNTGYVVHTLQTSLYDALTADSAEDAIIQSVNRGGDADTLGAVTGALAGARFGASELPNRWLDTIDERDELERLADELVETKFPPVGA